MKHYFLIVAVLILSLDYSVFGQTVKSCVVSQKLEGSTSPNDKSVLIKKYDTKGRLVEEVYRDYKFDSSVSIPDKNIKFEYNQKGFLVRKIETSQMGDSCISTFIYSSEGNLKEKQESCSGWDSGAQKKIGVIKKYNYFYNDKTKKLVKELCLNENGKRIWDIEYSYQENKEIRKQTYSKKECRSGKCDRVIERLLYDDGTLKTILTHTKDKEKLLEQEHFVYEEGKIVVQTSISFHSISTRPAKHFYSYTYYTE